MPPRLAPSDDHPFGPAVGRLVNEFASLPGIGRKTAERLTNHIVGCSKRDALALADAIRVVKDTVRHCSLCFNLTDQELCSVCSDTRRDRTHICIVEQPRDLTAIEATGAFPGTYHVLGGRVSPLEGITPADLTIDQLMDRVKRDSVTEIIMALNPTLEGDGTALYISNLFEGVTVGGKPVQITRLARGIATGSVLEFANKEMLSDALRGRQSF